MSGSMSGTMTCSDGLLLPDQNFVGSYALEICLYSEIALDSRASGYLTLRRLKRSAATVSLPGKLKECSELGATL